MDATSKAFRDSPGYSSVTDTNPNNSLLSQPLGRKKPLEETTNIIRQSQSPAPEISKSNPSIRRILAPQKKLRTQISKVASSKGIEFNDLLPYHQYRARQRRENNAEGDSVWDEETEKAFMDGLREVPRLGRRKLSVNGKSCGRNELIAEYIFKATGKHRTRKQVSSHIQVLKNLLRNNKEFMDLVSGGDKGGPSWEDELGSITNPKPNNNRYSTSTLGSQDSIESPNYHAVNDPFDQDSFLYYLTPDNGHYLIKPFKFSMWVGSTDATGSAGGTSIHEYTSLCAESEGHIPIGLPLLKSWTTLFPYAAQLHSNGLLDCPVIHFEAIIVTMDTLPNQSSIFCSQFEVIAADSTFDTSYQYECITRIYSSGKLVLDVVGAVQSATEDDGSTRLMLPFASDFWASFYTHLLTTRESKLATAVSEERHHKRMEKYTKDAVSSITVVQEVVATSILDTNTRVGLFLWEFVKAAEGQEGGVRWGEFAMPEPSFSSLQPVPRLKVDTLSDMHSHFKSSSPNLADWSGSYAGYDGFSLNDDATSSSPNIYLEPPSDLQDSPTAVRTSAFSLSGQSSELDEINLQYLQQFAPYTTDMAYPPSSDSQVLVSPWPQFPLFNSQDQQQTSCLENLI